ncbi:hypothetical protein F4777DRAFT_573133 [Nemania sp. FL0916]|nr:hypothetical protein F4777DRAFT_573133 [Nemania sp. FL0916]
MSSMSRNNSANSLMGFSVHQPVIGAPLQFFPAMGSEQLDEMINVYIPGNASILEKRAAVSMEFFEYSMATGDQFKFFMVYPTPNSASVSPTMDSGSCSGFTTSPVMSESQWSSPRIDGPSTSKRTSSANDFSNLPGMKIMTKDGRDVTNSASRGCKTKEQRDHAHLMRIMKACDSCRRKKTKCDPSHKRPTAGVTSGKITKKASKNPRPAAAPPQIAADVLVTSELDQFLSASSSSLDSFAESLNAPTDAFSMDWEQFVQYDEEPTESIPFDYDFFHDPAGYLSPATTMSFSSSSTSPAQIPITPIDRDVHITDDIAVGNNHKPILPYLNPGGLEDGSNYVDFNLYSPQSSFLDEELDWARELAASPVQPQRSDHHRRRPSRSRQEAPCDTASSGLGNNTAGIEQADRLWSEMRPDYIQDGSLHDTSLYTDEWSSSTVVADAHGQARVTNSQRANRQQPTPGYAVMSTIPAGPSVVGDYFEGVTSEGLYGRDAIYESRPSRSLSDHRRAQPALTLNTAGASPAVLQDAHAVRTDGITSLRRRVDTVTQTPSIAPQPYVARACGQDEPCHATCHAMDAIPKDSMRHVVIDQPCGAARRSMAARKMKARLPDQPATFSRTSDVEDSQSVSSSLAPSPAIATSLYRAIPSTSIPGSQPARNTGASATISPASVLISSASITISPISSATAYTTTGRVGGLPVSSSPRIGLQCYSGPSESHAIAASQYVSQDMLPTMPLTVGMNALPIFKMLVWCCCASQMSGIVRDTPSVLSAMIGYPIAFITLSFALYHYLTLTTPLILSALLIVGYYPQLVGHYLRPQQHTSSPAQSWSSNFQQPFCAKPLVNLRYGFLKLTTCLDNLIENFKDTYTKAQHVVQCDLGLAGRLKPRMHFQTSPTTSRSPRHNMHQSLKRTSLIALA